MSVDQVLEEARILVTPSLEEYSRIWAVARDVIEKLKKGLSERGYGDFSVSIQGSVARDTWLPGDRDIDVFVVLPKDYLGKVRDGSIVSDLVGVAADHGFRWMIKYAQHPYVQYIINDFRIDVVPCIKISPGERPYTAADRTPLHTEYVINKLSPGGNTEVRLLKAFLKSVGVYGAELKVRGFSGYVAELLVIRYGSFLETIKAMSKWTTRRVDLSDGSRITDKSPLILPDPVDPSRNAAAAVSREALSVTIAAAKAFLRKPSIHFFTGKHRWGLSDLSGRPVVPTLIIEANYPRGVSPDVVWGELGRLARAVTRGLSKLGFRIIHHGLWSDEERRVMIMINAESLDLPPLELHMGPPVDSEASEVFISKYIGAQVIGPFIRGSRWFVIRRRSVTRIEDAVTTIWSRSAPRDLRDGTPSMRRITSIEDLHHLDDEARAAVIEFLLKRPWWL